MEVGLNFNGDRPFEEIKSGAILSEKTGYTNIWVGESIYFNHPFPVIAQIANATKRIRVGSGIISYYFNRSLHIKKAFETLIEAFGERFDIALAPGDTNSLRKSGITPGHPLKKLGETIKDLRGSKALSNTNVYAGASGPKMIEVGSQIADGVLLNYAYPEYVKWALEHTLEHMKKDTYLGVYAPALLLPDEKNEKAVLMASAFVAAGSNPVFQNRFGLTELVEWVRKVLSEKRYNALLEKKDFLLERFTIHGDKSTILKRIGEFERMGVDQVILGSPFTYNHEAIRELARSL